MCYEVGGLSLNCEGKLYAHVCPAIHKVLSRGFWRALGLMTMEGFYCRCGLGGVEVAYGGLPCIN